MANTDADKVLHYVANPNGKYSLVKPDDETNPYQYYQANTLTKEVSIDADEKRVETFKDFLGNIILQRTVLDDKHSLDTYYVYDAIGQLCYVLSPLYQKNGKKAITAYEYRYDNRGRITKKILPGAEYVQYWYDNADRIVAMQDGVMRKDNKYRFTFYDNLGRLVVQGLSDYFNIPNDTINIVAEFIGSGGIGDTGYDLSYNPISQAKSTTIEIVNYYDNYNFSKGKKASCFSGLNNTTKVSQIGNLTGSLILCSNGEYVSQVMEYDLKGNLVKTTSRELGGRTVVNTNTYTFTNNVASSNYDIDVKHEKHLFVNETFTYNKYNNKKEKTTLAISHGNVEGKNTISYVYDELGRLSNVTRPFTATRAKNVSYEYEVHGWLKSITTNSFKEELFYVGCPDTKYDCYNGNIGTMKWSNNNYGQNRGYQFVYDKANRLTDAIYGERTKLNNKENRYNEVLEYDENGNITRLQRRGLKMDNEYGKIDNLSLSYDGNQLSYVEEDAIKDLNNTSLEFKKENGSGYKYNENGSLIADKNRGIAYITYDYNNNPTQIYFVDGHMTKYLYSASGQKLRTIHYTAVKNLKDRNKFGQLPSDLTYAETNCITITDYLLGGDLVMKNGKVDKFLFEGGYCQAVPVYKYNTAPGPMNRYFSFEEEYVDDEVEPIHIADTFDFYYYNQDHLGNNREVVDAKGVVQQVTNYYPFGAPYADATAVKGANLQPYKYNGKELDLMHGLNTYDYGARQHDPILARWDRIDPLCEKYYSTSPYAYCTNNPINAIDPDGAKVIPVRITGAGDEKKYTYYRSNETFRNAMIAFGKTQFGHQLLADFTPKGSTMFGVKGNGKYADFKLIIQELDYDNSQEIAADLAGVDAHTKMMDENGIPYFKMAINVQRGEGELAETILHELALHLSDYAEVLEAYKKGDYSKAEKVRNKTSQDEEHKDLVKKNPQFKGSIIYYNTLQEYLEKHPEYKDAFESEARSYEKVY